MLKKKIFFFYNFVILKLQYLESGNFVSLHHGLVLNKTQLEAYFQYCKDILSIKSNDYTDTSKKKIYFFFFYIF